MKNTNTITRSLVPFDQMSGIADAYFGPYFPRTFEPFLYDTTQKLSKDYYGSLWRYYTLSNGGFYVAPDSDKTYRVASPNGNTAVMSADALGITACLFAYSHLSFARDPKLSPLMAKHYHRLYAYTYAHKEERNILRIID